MFARKVDPERFKRLIGAARADAERRYDLYRQLAGIQVAEAADAPVAGPASPEGES